MNAIGIEKFNTCIRVIELHHRHYPNINNIRFIFMLFTLYANCHSLDKYLRYRYNGNFFNVFYQYINGLKFAQRSRPLIKSITAEEVNWKIFVELWYNLLEKNIRKLK